MASVTSLGIHKPTGVPYLVTEGLLPPDPPESLYSWQTICTSCMEHSGEVDELITTEHCVVWSRHGVLQRVFRFEVEGEAVTQAVLTRFPTAELLNSSSKRSKAAASEYPEEDDSPPISGLKIPKQWGSSSKSDCSSDSRTRKSKSVKLPAIQDQRADNANHGRAIVVVLKTQAHVYFLSGPSHVVHLPFEVEAVLPLPLGILLQRKLSEKAPVPCVPVPPSAPQNSFAFSQLASSWTMPSPQALRTAANLHPSPISASSVLPGLGDLLSQSRNVQDARLPRLFCLTDPLSELGNVVAASISGSHNKSTSSHAPGVSFDPLSPEECLLYVSGEDELVQWGSGFPITDPVCLALTSNESTGMYTIWSVASVERTPSSATKRLTPNTSGTMSRRRSSYGPGIGTGATTPVSRNSNVARDSLGITISHGHSHQQSVGEESFTLDNEDLASQLDPAFENPAAPAKSSRRVSSLLARADLSTSHDKSTFSELAGGHMGGNTTRRGGSFGAYGSRFSTGHENSIKYPSSRTARASRSSFDTTSFYDAPADDLLEELGTGGDLPGFSSLGLRDAVRGLRKELVMAKIGSIPFENASDRPASIQTSNSTKPEVFTLRPPNNSLLGHNNETAISMCLIDRAKRKLLVVQISVQPHASNDKSRSTVQRGGSKLGQGLQTCKARVTGVKRGSSIIDACKVRDQGYSQILVLGETEDGFGELTLQVPWSTAKKIELPSKLLLHDPFQLGSGLSPRQKREGGFKRVLSQGPQALTRLQHSGIRGQVDILDQESSRHRLEIQLKPRNPLVQKIIKVCDSVLSGSESGHESVLRGWWDVTSWLRVRSEEEVDLEWTAVIVVLFSMAVKFIGDRRTQTPMQSRRRKGGLLRSSSGANVDTDSWEAMQTEEASLASSTSSWIQDSAWGWTAEHALPIPQLSPQANRPLRHSRPSTTSTISMPTADKKHLHLIQCMSLAQDFSKSPAGELALGRQGYFPTATSKDPELRQSALATLLMGLHLFREELKLDPLSSNSLHSLTPVLAQIGTWLGWHHWGCSETSYYMLENVEMDRWLFDDSVISAIRIPAQPFEPPSIMSHIESINLQSTNASFMTLLDVANTLDVRLSTGNRYDFSDLSQRLLMGLTPRTVVILKLLDMTHTASMEERVAEIASCGVDVPIIETLPEGVAAPLRAAIAICQSKPLTTWSSDILSIVGRDDIGMLEHQDHIVRANPKPQISPSHEAVRDVHTICKSTLEVETVGAYDGSAEQDRQAITRMIWREDQRFSEAAKLVHPLKPAVAQCTPEPEWSDTDLLEAQKDLVQTIAIRTLSVSPGRALLFFRARLPLFTERFPIHGFTLSCVMKPANTTVTADRNTYTEEKVSWAFFHAGVEAGLSISRNAEGIDTSWILFNKPPELGNRHAGFLLALGLNGHLKSIAKWVAFKYLTPKHTMTSIGLLLGLSASYLGTMDTLITRLLSVHVTRMLPPGAAELNLSPLTQTTGIMGIGLLYCSTQHRRMSEVMLSEMENVDQDDNSSPLDTLRDEGYRLAAGFALGYINLGKGKDLKGLHDMHIVERLLALAVGNKKVSIVHILDKATAPATVAIALIFMKTQDEALARKIDIPDTVHQFDYVRPDIFLLRTVARHLIMWEDIRPTFAWVKQSLPTVYQQRAKLTGCRSLNSEDMPFYNIIAGLVFSIGLRYAGSGSFEVRNLLCTYLDQFIRICRLPATNYDSKLTRVTVRNCQGAVALAAASVMAGTGDLLIFRRLRSLHGRTDDDTPYGSHLAAHLAIGVLFLGGGTHTFGTSNLAIASLLCAFYPLFPTTVLDNKCHLQAFRHFWVLATEPRCLIARDIDSHRPVSVRLHITLHSGAELAPTAPCLLPALDTVATVRTTDPDYWSVTLDFAHHAAHRAAFARHQSIYVRRRAAYDAHAAVFSATLQALNDAQAAQAQLAAQVFDWVFRVPALRHFDRAERALVLPPRGRARGPGGRGAPSWMSG
ncbi:MAG: anaphase-promoting complex subunit 1 [Lasallia pustulata]|uniref:Anaphase-promoting complex subunit 1 n=1 Tax=Lasallia pustulata TaxID=136370 RepID=A0A5M8PJ61_9LECA|nr:MAG: anaphase-promoting complex subunit 1 [Lasallia pustulata]